MSDRTIIDIHVLQTVPPSNVNRDDTGSPKTAMYGGVKRARVSSQAWKRATRIAFGHTLDSSTLGVRTRRVVELLGEEILRQSPQPEPEAHALAEATLTAAGIKIKPSRKKGEPNESGYLLFLSRRQVHNLAGAAVTAQVQPDLPAALKSAGVKALADQEHSVDVALFGRMVADSTDLNVDAAAQVAHALSVHGVENEFDYFTAVDDHKSASDDEDAGAGMIGTVEFNSSTLYRYATVDVNRLQDNLGDAGAARRAVEAFVDAFVTSMPTGKQNTFGNRTLPDAVLIQVWDGQSVSYVGAFEEAVEIGASGGRLARAAELLAGYAKGVADAYSLRPVASFVVGVGERMGVLDAVGQRVSLAQATARVGELVANRLETESGAVPETGSA